MNDVVFEEPPQLKRVGAAIYVVLPVDEDAARSLMSALGRALRTHIPKQNADLTYMHVTGTDPLLATKMASARKLRERGVLEGPAHVRVDLTNHTIFVSRTRVVHLQPKQWQVFEPLVRANGAVVPWGDIASKVWPNQEIKKAVGGLRVFIFRLREVFEGTPLTIRTAFGVGLQLYAPAGMEVLEDGEVIIGEPKP